MVFLDTKTMRLQIDRNAIRIAPDRNYIRWGIELALGLIAWAVADFVGFSFWAVAYGAAVGDVACLSV